MVKIKIDKKSKLEDFLEIAVCNGTIRYTSDRKKINKPFFPAFHIIAKNDKLSVLAIDPYRKKTRAKFTLNKGLETIEEGKVPITDYEALDNALSQRGMPDKDLVFESEDGSVIKLYDENVDHEYVIRAKDSKYIKIYGKSQISKMLESWEKLHEFYHYEDDEEERKFPEDMLILKHPKEGNIPYPLKLRVDKDELLNIIGDAEKLTFDNKTRLVYNESGFYGMKGKGNSKFKSTHRIKNIENVFETNDFIFDELFYYLQTVVPNLFDKITFNFRRLESSEIVYMYLESENQDGSIRAEIGWSSVKVEDEE